MRTTWKSCIASVAALVFCTAASVASDGYSAGPVEDPEHAWVKWLCLALFIVAIGVAAFKNPKRTHLD